MGKTIAWGALLVILGVYDIREKKVPLFFVIFSCALAIIWSAVDCVTGERGLVNCLLGGLPGVFLWMVAWFTKKAGNGDGILLTATGMLFGYRDCALTFGFSLVLLALCSVVLLIFRCAKRDTKIPYIPFLCIGFFFVRCMNG